MEKLIVKQIDIKDTKEIRRIYKENFPKAERVPFKNLFIGAFENFKLYGFFNNMNEILGFVHLVNKNEFVHINYIAVDKGNQRKGTGSKIIQWVAFNFKKPIVVDVENFDLDVPNIEQRINRLKFYYKNGFIDGDKEFDWAGTKMFYMKTGEIPDAEFMKHITTCFPTITGIRPHKSNKRKIELYFKK